MTKIFVLVELEVAAIDGGPIPDIQAAFADACRLIDKGRHFVFGDPDREDGGKYITNKFVVESRKQSTILLNTAEVEDKLRSLTLYALNIPLDSAELVNNSESELVFAIDALNREATGIRDWLLAHRPKVHASKQVALTAADVQAWSERYDLAAKQEGWLITNDADDHYCIAKIDDPQAWIDDGWSLDYVDPKFDSDDEAVAHVSHLASAGSKMHQLAHSIHRAQIPVPSMRELKRMKKLASNKKIVLVG
jgi:hypothetical protein